MTVYARVDLDSDISSNVYTNVARLIKGNTVRDRLLNISASTLNKISDADVDGGYLAVNSGRIDISFINAASQTGKFLRDDGTWQTVAGGSSGLATILGIGNTTGGLTINSDNSFSNLAALDGGSGIGFSDGTNTGTFLANSANIQASFSNGIAGGYLDVTGSATTLNHDSQINFDSPIYNFTNVTADTYAYFDSSGNLVSGAPPAGTLAQTLSTGRLMDATATILSPDGTSGTLIFDNSQFYITHSLAGGASSFIQYGLYNAEFGWSAGSQSGYFQSTNTSTDVYWTNGSQLGQLNLGSSFGNLAHNVKLAFDSPIYNFTTATASRIAGFDSSKNLTSLSTSTYPSLTELSYIKGVTSAIQTQLNAITGAGYLTTISGIAAGGDLSGTYTNPTVLNSAVIGKVLTGLNITGSTIASTDSILDAFGKLQNQINGVLGGAIYQGVWNATTNSPSLSSGSGTKGYYYVVSVAGSTNLDSTTDWKVGDWAIFNGSIWNKVDNTDAVSSVNGYTGAVSLATSDIAESGNLYFTNARAIASTLTSYSSGAGVISSADTILQAIQKLNGNITALVTGVSSVSGTANRITTSATTGALTVDISSSYVGQSSITTLGTITTGVWNGTALTNTYLPTVSVAKGGNGLTTVAAGSIIGYNTADTASAITSSSGLKVLQNNAGTISWVTTTGTGDNVHANTPTLITPNIGVASATSVNKVAITAPTTSATLTISDGKTLSASNTITLTGTDSTSYNLDYIQSGADKYVVSSGTDTYTATLSPAPTAYVTGQSYWTKIVNTNTVTNPTLNYNSLGAKTIVGSNGASVPIGAFAANGLYHFVYDGTNMVHQAGLFDRRDVNHFRKTGTGTIERWYTPATTSFAAGTANFAKNIARAIPFVVSKTCTLDRIGIEITVGSTAGSVLRLYICSDTGNCLPGALLLNAGTIAADSATVQSITINQVLTPGLYWLCMNHNGTATLTVRTIPVSACNNILGVDSTFGGTPSAVLYTVSETYTATPSDPFNLTGLAELQTAIPMIGVRLSA